MALFWKPAVEDLLALAQTTPQNGSLAELIEDGKGAFGPSPPYAFFNARKPVPGKLPDYGFCGQPIRVDERADLAIGSLAPGDMGDLGREEIAAYLARRFRIAASQFAAVAVLADIATDGQVAVFPPERLKQAGGGPEPRIERFVDAMFLENICRDERQVVNGFTEFWGH
jgi:hypothetical protein